MRTYNASPEYLDDLCEEMIEWANLPTSYTIPQFLQLKNLGYPFFKYFIQVSDKVCNAYEIVKAILTTRWFDMAMGHEKLPDHKVKVLMRYMRLYDSHALDIDQMAKQQLQEMQVAQEMKYNLEKYDKSELREPYRRIYADNDDKRRSRAETQ